MSFNCAFDQTKGIALNVASDLLMLIDTNYITTQSSQPPMLNNVTEDSNVEM